MGVSPKQVIDSTLVAVESVILPVSKSQLVEHGVRIFQDENGVFISVKAYVLALEELDSNFFLAPARLEKESSLIQSAPLAAEVSAKVHVFQSKTGARDGEHGVVVCALDGAHGECARADDESLEHGVSAPDGDAEAVGAQDD